MRERILILLVVLATVSCKERESRSPSDKSSVTYQPDSNAVRLNNSAVDLIGQVSLYNDSLNGVLYDSALAYLDKAIGIDSLYWNAYSNKVQVLLRQGQFGKSLEVLDELQSIKSDFAEAIMAQGFILEKMGRNEGAIDKYKQALDVYKKRLKNDPGNLWAQSDIAFLYLFLEDKNRAIDEIQNLILENPNDKRLKTMERVIKDFNREKFIAEY